MFTPLLLARVCMLFHLCMWCKLTSFQALEAAGGDPSGWFIPDWTIEADQAICAKIGVTKAVLSVTAPGPMGVGDSVAAAAMARQCNDYVAQVCATQPNSYGFFACLPSLFDTEACLSEIKRALDDLHAKGVILYTRYGEKNDYLGHSAFRPVWEELSRRKAVVFVHPTHAVDTELVNPRLPQPAFDYPHETGRTAIDLISSGALREYCSECKIILSHAGGTLPALIGRVSGAMPFTPFAKGRTSKDIRDDAKLFYYDTALSSDPSALAALMQVADPTHILFGSDFPNAPSAAIEFFTKQLGDVAEKLGINLEAVRSSNASNLWPEWVEKKSML